MRWLLTSWGSSGDLHPFLALGRGLIARGHAVTLVGHPEWQRETESAGLRFVGTGEASRENFLQENPEVMSLEWGGLPGLHALIKKGMAPGFRAILKALLQELAAHDVLVAHHFVFPAPVAAELRRKPLVTVCLSPGVTPSGYDRPGPHLGPSQAGPWARGINRLIWASGKLAAGTVVDPEVNRLRRENGLSPIRDAVFGNHSSLLNLQLYSRHFAPLAVDWSKEKRQAGFCFYDPPGPVQLPERLADFLDAGSPPVLVTLGSAAVMTAGNFFTEATKALIDLKLRGVLLIGPDENRPPNPPRTIFATSYAPYGLIMPRVQAVMHQSGVGTLSHTLRAGVPSVACPFAFDQPNNARRSEALGVAKVVLPGRRTAGGLSAALKLLLNGPAAARAQALGNKIRGEDGVALACAILEETFPG